MKFKKSVVAALAAATVLAPALAPAPANAFSSLSSSSGLSSIAPQADVNQGDQLRGTKLKEWEDGRLSYSICTAGYINHDKLEVWTSDHCFDYGEEVTVGGKVIGKVTKEGGYEYTLSRGDDWEIITLDPDVVPGGNIYSGSRIDRTPEEGEEIKQYGQTTKAVGTTTITWVAENLISFCPTNSQGGDSGGPVWSEEGLVGINSGRGSFPACGTTETGYAALAKGIR